MVMKNELIRAPEKVPFEEMRMRAQHLVEDTDRLAATLRELRVQVEAADKRIMGLVKPAKRT